MEERLKTSNSFILLFIFLFLSLFLFLSDRYFSLKWLRSGFEKTVNPLKGMLSLSLAQIFPAQNSSLADPVILQSKIDYLVLENAKIVAELNQLREENEGLKKQLKAPQALPGKFMPAKNISIVAGLMTLDKGGSDGVKEGMVVVSEGVLVGRLVSVTPYASRVKLPTYEGNVIKVKILPASPAGGPSGEKGVLKGTAEGRLILDEVLQKVKLDTDQVLVTTGEDELYPADLAVARIEKIVSDDVSIYKKAELKPLLDYQNLKLVMIRL